jgi:uncharacterized protein YbaP (TraB family)
VELKSKVHGDAPSVAPKTLSIWSGIATLLAGLLLLGGSPARAEPAMWTIRDEDSTIVLFGSVHLLPQDIDWRSAKLDTALAQADDLWFETPTDDGLSAQLARQYGRLPAGESLVAMLSPSGRQRLERVSAKLGVSPAALDGLQPWLADISLSVSALVAGGARADFGVERVVEGVAPQAQRRYFETQEEQIGILAGASRADQLASLEETLRQLEEEPGLFDDLTRAWRDGDQPAVERIGVAPLKALSPALYESVLVGRNRRWVETILERLAGSGETVIIVGAGHLAGPDSVPALLRARGVVVEGP